MAAQNFKIKNGLTVGTTEVIDSSGDLTNAAFGTAALEAIDDQVNTLLTAGTGVSLSYDDSAGTLTINGQVGDIQGVTAGDGLSGGGTSGTVSLAVDLNELTAATVDIANDSVAIIDASDNSSKKETLADIASAMAGTGITATNGVLSTTVGDITSVVAGTNLSGGGTSGDVTLNVEQKLNNTTAPYYHNVVVTVSGGKFLFDGQTSSQELRLMPSVVYRFDQSDSTNANHPLRFSESSDGSEMSDGYTIYNKVGTPGSSGAYTEVAFDQEAPQVMYFYCSNHSGMGNSVALGSGDIAGVTAGDGLSGGGTSGTVTLSLNSSVAGDGLAHSSGVLSLDLNELTAATVDVSADSVPIIDGTATRKESIADIVTAVAGDGLSASSGVLAVGVDDSSIETNSDALRVKAGGVTNAMLAGSIANSKLSNSAVTVTAGDGLSGGGSVSLGSSVSLAVGVDDSSIETDSD